MYRSQLQTRRVETFCLAQAGPSIQFQNLTHPVLEHTAYVLEHVSEKVSTHAHAVLEHRWHDTMHTTHNKANDNKDNNLRINPTWHATPCTLKKLQPSLPALLWHATKNDKTLSPRPFLGNFRPAIIDKRSKQHYTKGDIPRMVPKCI